MTVWFVRTKNRCGIDGAGVRTPLGSGLLIHEHVDREQVLQEQLRRGNRR